MPPTTLNSEEPQNSPNNQRHTHLAVQNSPSSRKNGCFCPKCISRENFVPAIAGPPRQHRITCQSLTSPVGHGVTLTWSLTIRIGYDDPDRLRRCG